MSKAPRTGDSSEDLDMALSKIGTRRLPASLLAAASFGVSF